MASLDLIRYRDPNQFGENVQAVESEENKLDANQIMESWYSTKKHHNFSYTFYNHDSKPFSQLVWKSSKNLGLGIARIG